MDALVTILFIALVSAATLPLVALAVYAIASACGFGFANRILDVSMALLSVQWKAGGVLNAIGGCAIIALGIWCAVSLEPALVKAVCLVLVPLGIWRLGRGVSILRARPHSR